MRRVLVPCWLAGFAACGLSIGTRGFLTLLLVSMAGCGGKKSPTETTDPPVAATVILSPTGPFSGTTNSAIPDLISASVRDANGHAIGGVSVTSVEIFPTVISELGSSETTTIVPIVTVTVVHGTPSSGIGQAPILTQGAHQEEMVLRGVTVTERLLQFSIVKRGCRRPGRPAAVRKRLIHSLFCSHHLYMV